MYASKGCVVNLTPLTSKRGALATDARGRASALASLVEPRRAGITGSRPARCYIPGADPGGLQLHGEN